MMFDIAYTPPESVVNDADENRETKFPDGGWEAWLVVLGSWCAMIPAMGLLNSLAVLQAWLGEHDLQHLPASTTGWIFSIYTFFLFFCGAQIGEMHYQHLVFEALNLAHRPDLRFIRYQITHCSWFGRNSSLTYPNEPFSWYYESPFFSSSIRLTLSSRTLSIYSFL
jgi:hypothetical protein